MPPVVPAAVTTPPHPHRRPAPAPAPTPAVRRAIPIPWVALTLAVLLLATGTGRAAEAPDFETEVRPLLARYCLGCHSTEKQKGDLDLERFQTVADARREPKVWQNSVEQMGLGEMPPKDKPQPTPAERQRILDWIHLLLDQIAQANAGDPGPVILRRLSNAEYTYTLRDLTGVDALDPAREFPVDGAAGEGFMNTGSALVMSPALLGKYLDAARAVAGHAVLLPDGLRFAASTSRRDWSEEALAKIREFYHRHTRPGTSTKVHLQGLTWETDEAGLLPVERYLTAWQDARAALARGSTSIDAVAAETGLSPKYLHRLHQALTNSTPSLLLDNVRHRLLGDTPADPAAVAAAIAPWQRALWRFGSVGHIGKVGGPKAWMEPVSPRVARQEFRVPLTNAPVRVRLQASDAGDGNAADWVVWQRPRLVAPGRPELLLADLREVAADFTRNRARAFASVEACLAAADEHLRDPAPTDAMVPELARRHGVDAPVLQAWLETLGIGTGAAAAITGHFTGRLENIGGHAFVQGWGRPETPNLAANASDLHVRIPGNLRGGGVAIHPSPTRAAVVSWRSPVHARRLRAELSVTHAHPECGNGVTWALEARRGTARQSLAQGLAHGGRTVQAGAVNLADFRAGDVLSVVIGPRDGNHACDLTAVDLVITEIAANPGAEGRTWNLARDVATDILAGNPHPDRLGNPDVWHFHDEPLPDDRERTPALPAGSILARWRESTDPSERTALAAQVRELLEASGPADPKHPDAILRHQLTAPNGPLLRGWLARRDTRTPRPESASESRPTNEGPGPNPALFGNHPPALSGESDPASLVLQAPASLEFTIPAEFAANAELVVTASLHPNAGPDAVVQFRILTSPDDAPPTPASMPVPDPGSPFVATDDSPAALRLETAFQDFRNLFPAALCYQRIVPVDEVVTLTLYHREDDMLRRLMLDDAEAAVLDRLWDELHYVSHDAITLVDAFAQLMEYATQDADPKVFEPLREPIHARAAAFERRLKQTEPAHLEAVIRFAERAYRRPLRDGEAGQLRDLYARLRAQDLGHDDAIRMTLARVLVAPAFLYRVEEPPPGSHPGPVSDWEMASRLSYFLWSSAPDDALREAAASGRLRDPDERVRQVRRMLADPRIRRLAIEFGCQWLHIHGFDQLDEKSERHFPTFTSVRTALYEEAIAFFADFFHRDLPVRALLDADHTFLNGDLARHYGIDGIRGTDWRRVDDIRTRGRGGVLALGATLARQSGASRTSPILRGNWVSEVLLGEKLPRPPKDVPQLPEDEAAEQLTVRELVERHSQDPRCAGCHSRIDPYGFALEGYDAIGRARREDLGGRAILTSVKTADGSAFDGLEGLRHYLLTERRDSFVRQFARKLLGYALGRGVLLSDEPLIREIQTRIGNGDGPVSAAIETIVRSRQFTEIRGRDANPDDPIHP